MPPTYGAGMYGPPLQPQPQRSSVADMFVAGDFTAAAQRLQPAKMFDFDVRGYLGSVRQQPLPGINCHTFCNVMAPDKELYIAGEDIETVVNIGIDMTGFFLGGGTHGGTYCKSPAVGAKKTHFPTF